MCACQSTLPHVFTLLACLPHQVISKRKLSSAEEIEDVRREVQIMHHLAGHPNVVCLKNVYEDKANVCLAMEVCTGGELFDAIVKRGSYSEKVRDCTFLVNVRRHEEVTASFCHLLLDPHDGGS